MQESKYAGRGARKVESALDDPGLTGWGFKWVVYGYADAHGPERMLGAFHTKEDAEKFASAPAHAAENDALREALEAQERTIAKVLHYLNSLSNPLAEGMSAADAGMVRSIYRNARDIAFEGGVQEQARAALARAGKGGK
jgi:hypothetical protein